MEDVEAVVKQTLQLIGMEMKVISIDTLTYFEEIPRLKVSVGKIQQLLLGLLTNARQAIISDGVIMTALLHDGAHVRLRIGDSGGGIAPENINRIYDPFFSTKGYGERTMISAPAWG